MSAEGDFKNKYQTATSPNERLQVARQFAEKPKLVPITKKLNNGYEVTYYVGQKDVSVGNYPLALDPGTAQSLASQWGMHLPTGKIVNDIHVKANRDGTVANPAYLSASGFTDEKGNYHSAQDVVQNVGSHQAILEGARRVEESLNKLHPGGSSNKVTVTNGKILIQPTDSSAEEAENISNVYFKGVPNKVKKLPDGSVEVSFAQQGIGPSPHKTSEKNPYMEYCTFTRLVGDRVEVKKPDGSRYTTTLSSAMNHPKTYKAFSDKPKKPIVYKHKKSNKPQVTQGKPATQSFTQKAKSLYEGAKKKITNLWDKVFSQAEEFELIAISELRKTEIKKIAVKKRSKRDLLKNN